MKKLLKIVLVAFVPLVMAACNKEEVEPFDHPFFHIHVDNQDTVEVRYNRRDTVAYHIYLSAERQFDPIQVTYSVTPGSGLEEGRDYRVLHNSNTVVFIPGVFQVPVKIAWLEHDLDPAQDNSLSIKIESNSKDYTLGLPGPDHIQQQLVLIKKK
ncbi:hypothetical protein [Pontibacter actiniarum]|uniref:DUF4843 domain-containing protein n=1 Tax=Pontibacter actiniarum TaxID=323450 RepID=A0A1X9YS52_9BACT|nr:hypothetical protein [Pontibacter actiniarum]ARS35726.1 hypothetical protein CA264_09890 [Pontibacter actiniarum]